MYLNVIVIVETNADTEFKSKGYTELTTSS